MDTIVEESRNFSTIASTLLQEYTRRLDSLREDAERLVPIIEQKPRSDFRMPDAEFLEQRWQTINSAFCRLKGGLTRLARSTSQRLEHAELDEATHLELTVRLADFEAALERAEMSISNSLSEIHHILRRQRP